MCYLNSKSNRDVSAATVPEFVAERCDLIPRTRERAGNLYFEFVQWSYARGAEYCVSHMRFTKEIEKLGPVKFKSNGLNWSGIRLKPEFRSGYGLDAGKD